MSTQRMRCRARTAVRQRGQAALLTVLLLAVGVAAVIVTLAAPARIAIEADKATAAALVLARDALIGRAAADNNRPGSLPCPDVDNDGALTLGVDFGGGGACTATVGRLPWRTLGLPDLRDGSGERLWYAVSSNFRDTSGAAINSDSAGQFTVTGNAPAANVIAIVFAPGAVLPGQQRDGANQNLVANYLDGENSNGDSTFATGLPSGGFNDQLALVTSGNLFPVVETRVAREARQSLRNYYAVNAYYPPAAQLTGTAWVDGLYRGRVPTQECPSLPALALPAWFSANNWHEVMIYAVAPRCTPQLTITAGVAACNAACSNAAAGNCPVYDIGTAEQNCNNTAAGGYLTVDGAAAIEAIVLAAGDGLAGQTRPCAAIADCLEAVNGNTENIDADNQYIRPVRSAANNDGLVIVAP